MQSAFFRPAAATPELVFQHYEDKKRSYKNTQQQCEEAGFEFVPLVFEAHGGAGSPASRALFDWISKAQATTLFEDAASVSLRIAQRISCTLHGENARAILRRSAAPSTPWALPSGWEATEGEMEGTV